MALVTLQLGDVELRSSNRFVVDMVMRALNCVGPASEFETLSAPPAVVFEPVASELTGHHV